MRELRDDDFYLENGNFVLTERFHRRRGSCCGNGCRHCPFGHTAVPASRRGELAPPWPYFGEDFPNSEPNTER